jgi:hypothetical protein
LPPASTRVATSWSAPSLGLPPNEQDRFQLERKHKQGFEKYALEVLSLEGLSENETETRSETRGRVRY